jgi:hypothetical protein
MALLGHRVELSQCQLMTRSGQSLQRIRSLAAALGVTDFLVVLVATQNSAEKLNARPGPDLGASHYNAATCREVAM